MSLSTQADKFDLHGHYTRYANSPGGILARGNLDAMRRYVLSSTDQVEMRTRQRALLDQSTTDIVLWPDYTPSIPSKRIGKTSTEVVKASLYALPFLVEAPMHSKIATKFDWSSSRSVGVLHRLTRVFAEMLRTPSCNVRLLGATNVRNLLSTSPLQFQRTFRMACHQLEAEKSSSTYPVSRPVSSPLECIIPKELPTHWESSPSQPQAYVFTALVAQELQSSPPTTCGGSFETIEMAELLSALLAGDTSHGAASRASTFALSPSKIQVARIARIHDAITAAQGLELAWYAQYARKADLQFSMECSLEGPFIQVQINLTDDGGDSISGAAYCYDPQWRDPDHLSEIIVGVDMAQCTGQMMQRFSH